MNAVDRMLLIAERFPPDLGGVACSGARTADALARLGVEVHVLAWTKTLEPGTLQSTQANQPDGVTVHRLGLFSNWDFSMQHTLNVLEWLHGRHAFDAGDRPYDRGLTSGQLYRVAGLGFPSYEAIGHPQICLSVAINLDLKGRAQVNHA